MLLFVHDHKFRRVNGKIYTIGGLNNNVLQRYLCLDDDVCIYARILDENSKADQWSLIKENVTVKGDSSLSGKRLEEEVKKSDAIIIRLPSFLGNKACVLALKYNKPYMIEMVGCAWDSLYNHGLKGKLLAPYCFFLTKKLVRNAPYVIYVTEKFLQQRYPTQGKNIGCSDVVIDSHSSEILENRLMRINTRTGKRIIGTTAAVDVRYKGQEYMIKALSLLKEKGITDLEYQLVGNGDSNYLKKIAKEAGVENQVVFLGGLPHELIPSWLDSIDLYIQPSFQEGLPRALVEAQSRALPCFGSTTGGIPELLHPECVFEKKGNMAANICNILATLTVQDEIKYAHFGYDVASKYECSILNTKRELFYKDFYNNYVMKYNKL